MRSLNPNCQECDLHTYAKTVCMRGDGPRSPQDVSVVIIGEAPGANEDKRGIPFIGESGKVLRTELDRNNLAENTYITNLVKCRPPDNRTPTPAEIKACRPYLEQELEELKPKFVVTAGVPATKTIFRGKAKINEVHGEVIENEKVDYIGMPIFHPAYTLRDPSKLPGLRDDIARLARLTRNELRNDTVEWNVVRRGNLEVFLGEFEAAPEFAFDCEASGLFTFDPHGYITAIAFALPSRTWVIPGFMHPDYQQYSHSPFAHGDALKHLMQLLFFIAERDGKKCYAQNGKFDNKWFRNQFGGSFRLSFDTMLAHHVLDENLHHDLTSLCRTYLDEPEYDIPLEEKIGKSKKPMRNYKYCAQDATYTLRLKKIFQREIQQDKYLHRLFYKLVMPAARAMEDAEMEGLYIDMDMLKTVNWDLLARRVELEHELNELAGYELNWDSPQQIAHLLFEELGLRSTVKTDKGNPSTGEEALFDLMGKHEIPDKLIEYRKVAKFRRTYITGWKQYMVGSQLFLDYKLHGTVTGRYSSPLHPIPRESIIRNMICAPPGWNFVVADISQAELRIAAHLSGDTEMKRCFSEGIDIHWRTLMNMMEIGQAGEFSEGVWETVDGLLADGNYDNIGWADGVDLLLQAGAETCVEIWEQWKEGRYRSKQINFGYVFGMYEKMFIKTAKKEIGWEPTFDEAKQARKAYFNLYRGLEPWHSKQKKLARLNGHVRCMSGRLRRLPGMTARDRSVRSMAERQAVNSPVQGFIGDYKAMCLVEIHQTFPRSKLRLVGEHHDAALMIVKDGCEDECLPQVLEILKHPTLLDEFKIKLSVPMEGEVEVGPWGKGTQYIPTAA